MCQIITYNNHFYVLNIVTDCNLVRLNCLVSSCSAFETSVLYSVASSSTFNFRPICAV